MAYQPTLNDVQEIESQSSYTPTASDVNAIDSQNNNSSLAESISNAFIGNPLSALMHGIVGRGITDLAAGALTGAHNLGLNRKIPINYYQELGIENPNGLDKAVGGVGQYAPYAAGEELAIPALGLKAPGLLNALGRIGVRFAGGGTFGATQSEDPETGAIEGGAINAISEVLPSALKGIVSSISPQKHADAIINALGQGRTLQENSKSIAEDLKQSFEDKFKTAQQNYAPIFENPDVSQVSIYPYNRNYTELDQSAKDDFSPSLKKLDKNFQSSMTLENAHNLQSELGNQIRKFGKQDARGDLGAADRNVMENYIDARNSINSDINEYLSSKYPNLANQYNLASDWYRENITPYLSDSKISQIVKGDLENPGNLSTIFKYPDSDMLKIISDLPKESQNKLIYNELGRVSSTKSPEGLISNFQKLGEKGLDTYITPELENSINQLSSKIKNKSLAQKALGFGAGVAALHPVAGSLPLDALVGAIGAGIAPAVMRPLSNVGLPEALSNAMQSSYRPTTQSLIANMINQGNQ